MSILRKDSIMSEARRPRRLLLPVAAFMLAGATAFGVSIAAMAHESADPENAVLDKTPEKWVPAESGVNELGMTYGSGLTEGKRPDLIYAIGDDGNFGYVRATDLDGPANLEEAQNYEPIGSVPLYDKDGVTVIGTFTIGEAQGEETKG